MTLPPPFCVGDHGPWPYPESCLLSFQGASPADSSSCGWRVSLLLSARTYGGLAQGPAWAARCALTHHVPEAAQLDSSLSCWGRCLGRLGLPLFGPVARFVELPAGGVSLDPRTGLDRVTQSHCHQHPCFQACQLPPALETPMSVCPLRRHVVKAADLRGCRERGTALDPSPGVVDLGRIGLSLSLSICKVETVTAPS